MKLPRKSISWLSKHLGITKQMVPKYVYCIVVSFFLWNDPVTYGWSLLKFVQKKPRRPLASRISVGDAAACCSITCSRLSLTRTPAPLVRHHHYQPQRRCSTGCRVVDPTILQFYTRYRPEQTRCVHFVFDSEPARETLSRTEKPRLKKVDNSVSNSILNQTDR